MSRTLLFLSIFINCYAFSQNLSLNDTLNLDLQRDLSSLYSNRVQQQIRVFESKITNRRELKSVQKAYSNISSDFQNRIEKGVFYTDETIQAFTDNILKKYKNQIQIILKFKIPKSCFHMALRQMLTL